MTRATKLLFLAILFVASPGCSSIRMTVNHGPIAMAGTRCNIGTLTHPDIEYRYPVLGRAPGTEDKILSTIDIPFSLVIDLAILPISIPYTIITR